MCWMLDLVCSAAVRLVCLIWFDLIVGCCGCGCVDLGGRAVVFGGFLVCCLAKFLRVVAVVVLFVGIFAVDWFGCYC